MLVAHSQLQASKVAMGVPMAALLDVDVSRELSFSPRTLDVAGAEDRCRS